MKTNAANWINSNDNSTYIPNWKDEPQEQDSKQQQEIDELKKRVDDLASGAFDDISCNNIDCIDLNTTDLTAFGNTTFHDIETDDINCIDINATGSVSIDGNLSAGGDEINFIRSNMLDSQQLDLYIGKNVSAALAGFIRYQHSDEGYQRLSLGITSHEAIRLYPEEIDIYNPLIASEKIFINDMLEIKRTSNANYDAIKVWNPNMGSGKYLDVMIGSQDTNNNMVHIKYNHTADADNNNSLSFEFKGSNNKILDIHPNRLITNETFEIKNSGPNLCLRTTVSNKYAYIGYYETQANVGNMYIDLHDTGNSSLYVRQYSANDTLSRETCLMDSQGNTITRGHGFYDLTDPNYNLTCGIYAASGDLLLYTSTGKNIYVSSAPQIGSDIRLKENIVKLSDLENQKRDEDNQATVNNSSSNIIDSINVYQFNYKGSDKKTFGVIAQELQQLAPNMVSNEFKTSPDSKETYLAVDYIQFIPLLIKKCQDLQTQNNQLLSKLEELTKILK